MVYLLTSLPRIYTILMVGFQHSKRLGCVQNGLFFTFSPLKKKGKGEHHPYENLHVVKLGRGLNCRIPSSELWAGVRFKVTKRASNGLGHRTFFDEIQVSFFAPTKTQSTKWIYLIGVVLVGGFSNDCIWEICKFNQWHVGWSMRYIQRVELFSTYMLLEVQVPY